MKYTVALEAQAEGGYTVQCIELPGAISQGETVQEALENIQETGTVAAIFAAMLRFRLDRPRAAALIPCRV